MHLFCSDRMRVMGFAKTKTKQTSNKISPAQRDTKDDVQGFNLHNSLERFWKTRGSDVVFSLQRGRLTSGQPGQH